MKILQSPKNKDQFEKLKEFAKDIISILQSLDAEPILWGSLAYFAYVKPKDFTINDIDFLVPKDCLAKVIDILKQRSIRYNYVEGWDCLQIFKDDLRIELDPIEYYGEFKSFEELDFDGIVLKALTFEDLKRCYEKAHQDSRVSEVGPEKEEHYRKKFEELSRVSK